MIHVSPTCSQLRPRLSLISLRWLLELLRRVAKVMAEKHEIPGNMKIELR